MTLEQHPKWGDLDFVSRTILEYCMDLEQDYNTQEDLELAITIALFADEE